MLTVMSFHATSMCVLNFVLIFCLLFFNVHTLNCRSDGGPKGSELKAIYNKCLKMQDGKNSTNYHDRTGDHDWKDNRRNQRNDWERDQMGNEREKKRDRNDKRSSADGRMSYDSSDERKNNYGDNMGSYSNNDRMGSYGDRMGGYDSSRIGGRDSRMDSHGRDSMSSHDNRYGKDSLNGRNDFQHDDFGSGMREQYGYSTQPSRRYKRKADKKTENSGQRSQFNPNSSRKSGQGSEDWYRSDERDSNENNSSKEDEKKACALHCFLENLEMTAEDGMPDRYLVTHTLTKDVTNEDLKDFLQESIEECFQMLDNEKTEDKCEFSKNLLMCLSEKGRANCDDWKDDLRF